MDKYTLKSSFCNVITDGNTNEVTLVESDKGATLKEVVLYGIPPTTFIVKMDKIKVQNLFQCSGEWKYNKRCDYLIVSENEIVMVEMKSFTEINEKSHEDIRNKFKSDRCILEYCDSIFSRILDKNPFFKEKPVYYVLLYQALPISMSHTRLEPYNTMDDEAEHIIPEKFAKIQIPNQGRMPYARLLYGK